MPEDGNNQTTPQVEGQVPGQVPPATTPEAGYITQEQFNQAMSELKETLTKSYRAVQSDSDKKTTALRQEVQTTLSQALNAVGVKVTDQQLAEAQRKMILDELINERLSPTSATDAQTAPGKVQAPAQPRDEPDPITLMGAQLAKELGVDFPEDSPEYAEIVKAAKGGSAMAYLDAIRTQAEAYKKRAASEAGTRIVGSTAGAQAQDLLSTYRQEMINARGNKPLVQAIKAKYKAQGVPVDNVIFS